MADGTGKLAYNSDLIRKKWMTEGLVQKAATSFWAPYTGTTSDSIITVTNDIAASAGMTVVFDYDGNLSGRPVKGNTTAKGTGEQKKKFSDKVTVADYRYVVDNGTKFNGVEIGDLNINEHSDSRSKLADLYIRSKDQAMFDTAQQSSEFRVDLGSTFTLDSMLDVETVIKTGSGFDVSPSGITKRLPLKPFKLQNGEPVWLVLCDTNMKNKFLRSTGAQTLLSNADVRGNENRLIKGMIGKIGSFIYVDANTFFGTTEGSIQTNGYYNYDSTGVEIAGLRRYDSVNAAWEGTEGFDIASTLKSRGVILGANAIQHANGMMPNYEVEYTDFKKFSESCMEIWCGTKATKLVAENSDYANGKVAGYNYGMIGLDITI